MGATRPVHPGSLKFNFSQRVVPGRWASGRPERWTHLKPSPASRPPTGTGHSLFLPAGPQSGSIESASYSASAVRKPGPGYLSERSRRILRNQALDASGGHGLRTFGDSKSDAVRRIALRDESLALEPRASRQPYLNRSGSHSVPSRTIA